ncbi:hypothetical protein IT414_03065 [bacterium]|nr:hypothetical protein [bacterium]
MAADIKCPNCEEKDRVTIAGRVFCVNCGTPFDDGVDSYTPRPVAPAAPQVDSPSQASSPPSATPPSLDPKAEAIKSLLSAEPRIIPASASKHPARESVRPSAPASPLESFDDSPISAPASTPVKPPVPAALPPLPKTPSQPPSQPRSIDDQLAAAKLADQQAKAEAAKTPPAGPKKSESIDDRTPAPAPAAVSAPPVVQPPIPASQPVVAPSMPTVAPPATPAAPVAPQPTPVAPMPTPTIAPPPQQPAPAPVSAPSPAVSPATASVLSALTPTPAQSPAAVPATPPVAPASAPAAVQPTPEPVSVIQSQSAQKAAPASPVAAPTAPSANVMSIPTQPTEHIGSEIVSLDAKDESVLSDEAFSNLINSPSIIPDGVKKVSTAKVPKAATAPASPPPFVPPAAPITASSTTVIPSPTMVDIQAPVSAPAPVQPPAPVAQPVVAPPVQPANQPPARIMTDITSSKTQLNGAAVLPVSGGLNIHPSHSFMAEPGVAAKAGEVDPAAQAAKEQALKMALSSVADQGAPQIGASFKPANVALSLVAVALLGFYIWQVNYPNLAIKVAAAKSGVTATVPSYLPSGWKIGRDISAAEGTLTYNVINPSSNKSIRVVQSRSEWDSQALAENYIAQKYPGYSAYQVQGLTIYLYGENQASWVRNGNWFRLEGETQALGQDQIIKLATSL